MGFDKKQFADAFERYVLGQGGDSKRHTVTSQQNQALTSISKRDKIKNVTVEKSPKLLKSLGCHGVTVENEETAEEGYVTAENEGVF